MPAQSNPSNTITTTSIIMNGPRSVPPRAASRRPPPHAACRRRRCILRDGKGHRRKIAPRRRLRRAHHLQFQNLTLMDGQCGNLNVLGFRRVTVPSSGNSPDASVLAAPCVTSCSRQIFSRPRAPRRPQGAAHRHAARPRARPRHLPWSRPTLAVCISTSPNSGLPIWNPGLGSGSQHHRRLLVCLPGVAGANPEAIGQPRVGRRADAYGQCGSRPGQVAWTSPWTGSVTVSGALWPTRSLGRENIWRLQLVTQGAAKTLASGELPEDGTVTRRKPSTFKLPALAIHEGEVLELQVMRSAKTTPWGDFAAMTFSITQDASPPAAMPRAAAGGAMRPAEAPIGGPFMMMLVVVMVLLGFDCAGIGGDRDPAAETPATG